MTKHLGISLAAVALAATAGMAEAQQAPDPRVADLIQTGRLRVELFAPMYTRDSQRPAGSDHANLMY